MENIQGQGFLLPIAADALKLNTPEWLEKPERQEETLRHIENPRRELFLKVLVVAMEDFKNGKLHRAWFWTNEARYMYDLAEVDRNAMLKRVRSLT